MVNTLILRSDLDEYVARRWLQPYVRDVAAQAAAALAARAPDAKVWLTQRDERVRPSHVDADAQTIPANLRYRLRSADRGVGTELARAPRDPNLRIANRANCRCASVPVTGAIARTARAEPVEVLATRVTAAASVRFHRVVESEWPDVADSGGGWARTAVNDVAARLRGAQATRT